MVFVDPITCMFALCAAPVERAIEYLINGSRFDSSNETYLEVTISDNSLYSSTAVKI